MAYQDVLTTDTPNQGRTKWNANDTELYSSVSALSTIGQLRSLDVSALALASGATRTVLGYYAAGDGGGGTFRYDTTAATSFSVSAATDTLTATAHPFSPFQKVVLYSLSGATGLASATTYYVILPTTNTFKLASSWANALTATPVNVTLDGSGFINLGDDGGMVIAPSSNPTAGRWIRTTRAQGTWDVRHFGVVADGVTDRTTEMTGALVARQVLGGRLEFAPHEKRYAIAGPLPRVTSVIVQGFGHKQAEIAHTGNNLLFDMRGGTNLATNQTDADDPRGLERLKISGNSGASAQAFLIGDARSPVVRDVSLTAYTAGPASGMVNTGTTLGGDDLGTEGAQVENLITLQCKNGFALSRSTTGGSTYSFSDFRMRGSYFELQSVANAIGLYVGEGIVVYYGTLEAKFHTGTQAGATAIYMDGTANAAYLQDNHYNLAMESGAPNPGTFIRMGSFDEFTGYGVVTHTVGPAPSYTIPSSAKFRIFSQEGLLAADARNNAGPNLTVDASVRYSSPANPVYYLIATLPVDDTSNWNKLLVSFYGGAYPANEYTRDEVLMANRGGFLYSYSKGGADRSGSARSNTRVQAYSQVDGSINVYARLAAGTWTLSGIQVRHLTPAGEVTTASPNLKNMRNLGIGSAQVLASPPTGTLIFDSADSTNYPANTPASRDASADNANTSPSLTHNSATIQRFDTALTANRTVTLPTTNVPIGREFDIVRTGLGAFTLTVSTVSGGNPAIAASSQGRVLVRWNGSVWQLIEKAQWT